MSFDSTVGRVVRAIALVLALTAAARAQAQPGPYFYRGLDYGSQSTLTPLTIWLNRGFESARLDRSLVKDIDWGRGIGNAWGSVVRPGSAIRRGGGWRRFFDREINPFGTADPNHAAWFPNYTSHLLSGGIEYRYVREWYESRGVPHPRLAAAVSAWTSGFMNEVVESHRNDGPSAASAADLLIFDMLAMPLFEIDGVARFFGHTLRASDWSPMASLTVPALEIENTASEIAFKFPLPFVKRAHGVYTQGMDGLLGAMVDVGESDHVGAAFGLAGSNRTVDPVTLDEHVDLVFSWAAYWDRNDSLLGSVLWRPQLVTDLVVNVYPGALPGFARHVGVWATRQRDGGVHFGFATRKALGMGFRLGR
jgi:hypothetical protein